MIPTHQMIDLSAQNPRGVGPIAKLDSIRRDGEKEGALMTSIVISFAIDSVEDAEIVDRAIPGAARLCANARNARAAANAATAAEGAAAGSAALAGESGTTTVSVASPHVLTTIRAEDDEPDAPTLTGISAEITGAKLKATGRSILLQVKVAMYRLTPDDVRKLCTLLDRPVLVELDRKQQQLFGASTAPAVRPGIGAVAVGATFAGEVTGYSGDDDDTAEITDIDGSAKQIPVGSITSSFSVAPPPGKTLDAVLSLYSKRADKGKADANWFHLITALGNRVARGDAQMVDDAYVIDNAVIDDAIELARGGAAQAN